MSKIVFLAVAAALLGAGNALQSYAENGDVPETPAGGGGEGEPAKRGRGRPPGGSKSAETPTGGAPAEDDATRFEKNRGLIKPLVDAGQGEDVKKVIAKYSKTGLKDLPAASQAEFEKDIAALSY